MTDYLDGEVNPKAVLGLLSFPEMIEQGVRVGVYSRFNWNADRDALIEWASTFPPDTRFKAVVTKPVDEVTYMIPGEEPTE